MGPNDWPTRDMLAHRVASTPDPTALVSVETGQSWSYRELDSRVSNVAGQLAEYASQGVRIGLLLENRVEVIDLVHAAMRRTVSLVPLNVRLTGEELRPQVEAANLNLLICEANTESLAVEIADCQVVSVDEPDSVTVDSIQPARNDGRTEGRQTDLGESLRQRDCISIPARGRSRRPVVGLPADLPYGWACPNLPLGALRDDGSPPTGF